MPLISPSATMSQSDEKRATLTFRRQTEEAGLDDHDSLATIRHADDILLAKLGYKSEFRRKISVRWAMIDPFSNRILWLT